MAETEHIFAIQTKKNKFMPVFKQDLDNTGQKELLAYLKNRCKTIKLVGLKRKSRKKIQSHSLKACRTQRVMTGLNITAKINRVPLDCTDIFYNPFLDRYAISGKSIWVICTKNMLDYKLFYTWTLENENDILCSVNRR